MTKRLSYKVRDHTKSTENSDESSISADSIALAELVTYINEQTEEVDAPVFQLSTLTKKYQDRIEKLGSEKKANSTRLKKKNC